MNYSRILHFYVLIILAFFPRTNSMEQNRSIIQNNNQSTIIILHHTKADEVQKLLSSYVQFLSLELLVLGENTLQIVGTNEQLYAIDQLTILILTCIDIDDTTQANQSTNFFDIAVFPPFF